LVLASSHTQTLTSKQTNHHMNEEAKKQNSYNRIYKGFALVKTPASRACEVHTVNRVICKSTIELLVLNWEIRKKLPTRRFQVMNKTKAVNQTKKHDGVK